MKNPRPILTSSENNNTSRQLAPYLAHSTIFLQVTLLDAEPMALELLTFKCHNCTQDDFLV